MTFSSKHLGRISNKFRLITIAFVFIWFPVRSADVCAKLCSNSNCCVSFNGAPCASDAERNLQYLPSQWKTTGFVRLTFSGKTAFMQIPVTGTDNSMVGMVGIIPVAPNPAWNEKITVDEKLPGVFYVCTQSNGCCLGNPCTLSNGNALSFTPTMVKEVWGTWAMSTTRVFQNQSHSWTSWSIFNVGGGQTMYAVTLFNCAANITAVNVWVVKCCSFVFSL